MYVSTAPAPLSQGQIIHHVYYRTQGRYIYLVSIFTDTDNKMLPYEQKNSERKKLKKKTRRKKEPKELRISNILHANTYES